ncbi:MAG: GntR family transcriptional regulator [Desulfobacterales bacterium]|nr:GntR family transcriptional regulator [Desulfobacterales bacterium]
MKFISTANLTEQIAHYLSEKIIKFELKPNERIYEEKLSKELGVSRSPIREALRILERNKLVEIIPRRGAKVTELTPSYVECLYDVLKELYALVTRKGVENKTQEVIDNICAVFKKLEASALAGDTVGYYNNIFEYALIALKAANNPLLEQVITELWPGNRRIQFATLSVRASDLLNNLKFFKDTLKYIKEGNSEMAELVIRSYAQNEKEYALNFFSGEIEDLKINKK